MNAIMQSLKSCLMQDWLSFFELQKVISTSPWDIQANEVVPYLKELLAQGARIGNFSAGEWHDWNQLQTSSGALLDKLVQEWKLRTYDAELPMGYLRLPFVNTPYLPEDSCHNPQMRFKAHDSIVRLFAESYYKEAESDVVMFYYIPNNLRLFFGITDKLQIEEMTFAVINNFLDKGMIAVSDITAYHPWHEDEPELSDRATLLNRIKADWHSLKDEPTIGDICSFIYPT